MAKTMDEISAALMKGLYGFVAKAAGDLDAATVDDPFVCWCKPGIPFEPDDFKFAKFMLAGQGSTADERAADLSLQMRQASGFSRFVDFVPSVNGVHEGKVEGGVLRQGNATLSELYKRILEASQTADLPEPEGVNEKIAALRAKAKTLEEAYFKFGDEFDAAKAAYVGASLMARADAMADLKFRAAGPGLKKKAQRALQAWEIDGAKTEYENLTGEIQSLAAKRKPANWRAEAITSFNTLPDGEDATFGEARISMPYPGGFAANATGWSSYALSLKNVDELSSSKSTKWAAGGGVGWGSLKIGATGSGSTTQSLVVNNTDSFSINMSIAQVSLLRKWFDPWFLRSEFWRFNPASMESNRGDIVSDGGMPPKGLMVAYPVSAIFIRGVEIVMDELKDETSELVKTLKAEGKGGWGLGALNLGGSYERNSQENKHKADVANGKLTVSGLQCIGFVCETMNKSPNPKPGADFGGGA
jgi:hypothetical protein